MASSVQGLLRDNYGRIAKDLVTPLVDLLAEAHRLFSGDVEKLHIMLVIALRTAEHRGAAELDIDAIEHGEIAELPSLATNVKSISAGTGIPEETVRRKVRTLAAEGWIQRHDHALSYTPKAAQEMEGVRRILLRMAERNHAVVKRLLLKGADGSSEARARALRGDEP